MNGILYYIRTKSSVSTSTLAHLLHTSVYTYIGYESGRLLMPTNVSLMLCEIFKVNFNNPEVTIATLPQETLSLINLLQSVNETKQLEILIRSLTNNQKDHLTYREIQTIKQQFLIQSNSEGAP